MQYSNLWAWTSAFFDSCWSGWCAVCTVEQVIHIRGILEWGKAQRSVADFWNLITPLFGATKALGLTDEMWQQPTSPEDTHGSKMDMTHFTKHTYCTSVSLALLWSSLWRYIPPCWWAFLRQISSKKPGHQTGLFHFRERIRSLAKSFWGYLNRASYCYVQLCCCASKMCHLYSQEMCLWLSFLECIRF